MKFTVCDIPASAGSKRGFVNRKTGGVIITEDCKRSKTWRESVKQAALKALNGCPSMGGAVAIAMTFYLPRPKGHYGTGRNAEKLKPSAPQYPTTKPDLTKIIRSTEDAMTGLVWRDDAQVVDRRACKRYADGRLPGVDVEVWQLTNG